MDLGEENNSTSSGGVSLLYVIFKWTAYILLIALIVLAVVLSILAWVKIDELNKNVNKVVSTCNNDSQAQGPQGPQGPQGAQGPPGPKGMYTFVASSNISGVFRNNSLIVPTVSKIPIVKSSESNLVFTLSNLLTDTKGDFFVKSDGIYQFNITLASRLSTSDSCNPGMILRGYHNDNIVCYYEILQSGSQSISVPIQCKKGDVVRFGIISQDEVENYLVDYGTIMTAMVG
jgi:hypothetical protein